MIDIQWDFSYFIIYWKYVVYSSSFPSLNKLATLANIPYAVWEHIKLLAAVAALWSLSARSGAVFGNFRWERRQLQQLQQQQWHSSNNCNWNSLSPLSFHHPVSSVCCAVVCAIWKLFVSMTNDSNLSKSCNLPNAQVRESEQDSNRERERGRQRSQER